MYFLRFILPFGVLALASTVLPLSARGAGGPVIVELTDGDCVEAALDARTDGSRLWLTTNLASGSLSQSIPWEHVHEVEIAGQNFEGRLVRIAVETIRDAEASPKVEPASPHRTLLDGETLKSEGRPWQSNARLPDVSPRSHRAPRVEAMTVSARLANWDQDLAVDGLVVELRTYDSDGARIACNGNVTFALQTWKSSGRDDGVGMHSERWTRAVRGADFESGSVHFRLPFRVIEPQDSSDWCPHGALHVRMAIPGSGVVERTVTDVRVREIEPMRDTLEQNTGRRYFPSENIQRQAWAQSRR